MHILAQAPLSFFTYVHEFFFQTFKALDFFCSSLLSIVSSIHCISFHYFILCFALHFVAHMFWFVINVWCWHSVFLWFFSIMLFSCFCWCFHHGLSFQLSLMFSFFKMCFFYNCASFEMLFHVFSKHYHHLNYSFPTLSCVICLLFCVLHRIIIVNVFYFQPWNLLRILPWGFVDVRTIECVC
jgi:hypothetical protein